MEYTMGIGKEKNGGGELELYLHIPFCVKKCNYCDFLSAPADEATKKNYIRALQKEIQASKAETEGYVVHSVFVGGGTPSVISSEDMTALFQTIRETFCVDENAEITIEINPGTVDEKKLEAYRKCGINRISIGLQSTRDSELEVLGRIHKFSDFLNAYELVRKVGFKNVNVDLMSALPEQTTENFLESLQKVLGLIPPPEHVSAYSLIVEEGTAFYAKMESGELSLPSEEEEREMYAQTEQILKQFGYERYEISNYCKPGFKCRHNDGYWLRKNYLGFGIGAASCLENQRFSNERKLIEYIKNPLAARGEKTILTMSEQMEETMFLGLRRMEGVDRGVFFEQFGKYPEEVYGQVIEKNQKDGLLVWDEDCLRLTSKGIDISNYVMAQFLF